MTELEEATRTRVRSVPTPHVACQCLLRLLPVVGAFLGHCQAPLLCQHVMLRPSTVPAQLAAAAARFKAAGQPEGPSPAIRAAQARMHDVTVGRGGGGTVRSMSRHAGYRMLG